MKRVALNRAAWNRAAICALVSMWEVPLRLIFVSFPLFSEYRVGTDFLPRLGGGKSWGMRGHYFG